MQSTTQEKKSALCRGDFEVGRKLGKGAYGDVFYVRKDYTTFAMKQIQKKKLGKENKQYQAIIEKELLKILKHQGIIKLKYAFQEPAKLYFILEFCEGGDLLEFIKLNLAKIGENIKTFYVAEIVHVLQFLHQNGITHRDLKPQNLMLSKNGHLKFIDFGTAEITKCKVLSQDFKSRIQAQKKKLPDQTQEETQEGAEEEEEEVCPSPKKRRSTFVGTSYYISPELLEHNICEQPSDLWALGCILYQLYYTETPFKDSYEYSVFQKIKAAKVQFPKNEVITDDAIDLIKKLLVKDPECRLGSNTTEELSYAKLKSHPYFKGLDIDNIFNTQAPLLQKEPNLQEMQSVIDKLKSMVNNKKGAVPEYKQQDVVIEGVVEIKVLLDYQLIYLMLCKNGLVIEFSNTAEPIVHSLSATGSQKSANLLSKELFTVVYRQGCKQFIKVTQAQKWVATINQIKQQITNN